MDEVKVVLETASALKALRGYADRLDALDLSVVVEELKLQVDNKIQAEGALFGAPRWPELSEQTLARRPGAKMLQRTGLLANVQGSVDVSGGERTVVVASPAPYAGFHVTGTFSRGQVRMPRRDFFDLDFDEVLEGVGLKVLDRVQ